jgi:hypothetical protein
MIQRIQSVFLFLAGCGFGLQFLTDFFTSAASYTGMLGDKILEIQDNPILLGLTIAGILLSLGAIFLYSNRPLQKKLAIGSGILAIILPAVAGGLSYQEVGPSNFQSLGIQPQLGAFLPLISIVFSFLANKYISKDDKLVRSMDRLR